MFVRRNYASDETKAWKLNWRLRNVNCWVFNLFVEEGWVIVLKYTVTWFGPGTRWYDWRAGLRWEFFVRYDSGDFRLPVSDGFHGVSDYVDKECFTIDCRNRGKVDIGDRVCGEMTWKDFPEWVGPIGFDLWRWECWGWALKDVLNGSLSVWWLFGDFDFGNESDFETIGIKRVSLYGGLGWPRLDIGKLTAMTLTSHLYRRITSTWNFWPNWAIFALSDSEDSPLWNLFREVGTSEGWVAAALVAVYVWGTLRTLLPDVVENSNFELVSLEIFDQTEHDSNWSTCFLKKKCLLDCLSPFTPIPLLRMQWECGVIEVMATRKNCTSHGYIWLLLYWILLLCVWNLSPLMVRKCPLKF